MTKIKELKDSIKPTNFRKKKKRFFFVPKESNQYRLG